MTAMASYYYCPERMFRGYDSNQIMTERYFGHAIQTGDETDIVSFENQHDKSVINCQFLFQMINVITRDRVINANRFITIYQFIGDYQYDKLDDKST
jgi:hypothetical protein